MQSQKYEKVLSLKITYEMRDQVAHALFKLDGGISTVSEFIRASVAYALESLHNEPPESFRALKESPKPSEGREL